MSSNERPETSRNAGSPKPGTAPQYPQIGKNDNSAKTKSNLIEVPSIALPKGGGAIKSIDEKFQVNAANGTASFSIPFPVSQARGFVPSLALNYNSGGGNSPFGLGWSLEAPSIVRKTDKKLPEYRDEEESDTFTYSGAEDLVPYLDANGNRVVSADGRIRRYRPRVEGGFARIEKITENGTAWWRVTTRDNIVSIFGRSATARLADPADPRRIFQWFLEFSYDDKGHCILYRYKQEDRLNVPHTVFERNRANGHSPVANTYLKSILYCNNTPWYPEDGLPQPAESDYLLSVVFDYGEYEKTETPKNVVPTGANTLDHWATLGEHGSGWAVRRDAFSEYRPGFEVRTYRLCRRILQFHHFQELQPNPYLVRSMEFTYDRLPREAPAPEPSPYVNDRPFLAYLRGISQCGYIWNPERGQYSQKSLPPLTFDYEQAPIFSNGYVPDVLELNRSSLVSLPVGLDDQAYTWTDLYSEGISGVLTEQAEGWYYKENFGDGEFSPAKLVLAKPSFSGLSSGAVQLQDLESNGLKQLVATNAGARGYFELSPEEDWQPFVPFERFPNVDLRDPNAKFIDLNGDGMADLLITEQDVFVWYPGKGKVGYDEPSRVQKAWDEERGPNVVFADQTQSVILTDMDGDGMTDIVRIRNGEVCYWPNLGYGRFGAKVTMDNAPVFDAPELFNPRYIKLADIDGTGTTDIIYLAHNEFKIWFNHSGNTWSHPTLILNVFPQLDSESDINVIDLLGNGTSCIVWSSPLPQYAGSPLRYIDLTNGRKPHIMTVYRNNLGKEISVQYRSSTGYYLDDKRIGEPWVTKLPFPVQCVQRVEVRDLISQTRFVNEYRYRHGYYDYHEREFRGFAYVEQTDTEAYEDYRVGAPPDGIMNTEPEFYQPRVINKSWFHTGAFLDRERVLHQLQDEYYPNALIRRGLITDPAVLNTLQAHLLPEAPRPTGLNAEEFRECLRALKGLPLRQEVYSDEGEEAIRRHPYSVTQFNYDIQRLQAKGQEKHAVFFPLEQENLAFQYERNPLDPRIAHSINLEIDPFGNVLQSAAIVYGRLQPDASLPTATDREQQATRHITYTQNNFTNLVDDESGFRLPAPCETQTWELVPTNPAATFYRPEELRQAFSAASAIPYFQTTQTGQKRKIEHIRTCFLGNNLAQLLPLGRLESLALPGEACQLAMTPDMVPELFGDRVNDNLLRNTGRYTRSEVDDNYWVSSGRIHFHPDLSADPFAKTIDLPTGADLAFARSNFFMPVVYEDNFGNLSKVFYDLYRLFPARLIDPADNETAVEQFNYRTLAPWLMRDINNNRSGVRFDEMGLVTQTFVMGKATEQLGDLIDLESQESSAGDDPTTRLRYEFRYYETRGRAPNRVLTEARERHRFQPLETDDGNIAIEENANPVWQRSYSYSDGSGHEVLKKVQAEPGIAPLRDAEGRLVMAGDTVQMQDTGTALRWVGNGRTILNNKGNPVKQYEPFFDSSPEYNDEAELVLLGFTPLLYYDAPGRLIRTENPNGTFSRVEFDAWMQRSFDENDTAMDSDWYARRIGGALGADEQDAAQKTETHYNTPTAAHLDSLGRPFLSIAHNRTQRSDNNLTEEYYHTRSYHDIEGNPLRVVDARGNPVMRWYYDMLGNVCRQESTDAGIRWQLNDATGKPIRTWDSRNHTLAYIYDALHRPVSVSVNAGSGARVFEQYQYGDGPDYTAGDPKALNLRGQVWRHFDTAGLMETLAVDFKGNVLRSSRRLLQDYKNMPDWASSPALEDETFASSSSLDALNRPIRMRTPDNSVFLPEYNAANLLEVMRVRLRGAQTPTAFVTGIDYNARGQRERIQYGNNTASRYRYEPETYRLTQLLTTADNGAQILQDLNYVYDPVGNITRIFDNAQKTVFYGGQAVEALCEYHYDALYRLIEASGREHIGQMDVNRADDNWDDAWSKVSLQPNSPVQLRHYTQRYTYDPVGNILRMQHIAGQGSWTRNNQYNPGNNQLTRSSIGNRNHTYTYNEHGSMAAMPQLTRMNWNFKEELTHVGLGGGGQAWYVYDAGGQRVRKVVERQNAPTEERIYIGGFELYRQRNGDTVLLERETLHVMDGQNRVAMIETRIQGDDGSPAQLQRYQYANHLGTACLELDEQAQIISCEEYHPYGTTAYQVVNADLRAAAKRYRYTGMERDEETGLNYNSARYYFLTLSKWISNDPIGIVGGINSYRYGNNNPLNGTDNSGMFFRELVNKAKDAATEVVNKTTELAEQATENPLRAYGNYLDSTVGDALRYVGTGLGENAGAVLVAVDQLQVDLRTKGLVQTAKEKVAGSVAGVVLDAVNVWNGVNGVVDNLKSGETDKAADMYVQAAKGAWSLASKFVGGRGLVTQTRSLVGKVTSKAGKASASKSPHSIEKSKKGSDVKDKDSMPLPLTPLQIITRLERHVARQNARIANAIRNGDRAFFERLKMSSKQIDSLMDPSAKTFAAEYGNAMEKALSRAIKSDSKLSGMLEDIHRNTSKFFPVLPGKGGKLRPDFGFNSGPLEGNIVDLTTSGGKAGKMAKYHDRVIVLEYSRPF